MNARERFERLPRIVARLNEIKALIMFDCDDWKPPKVKARNESSDPTANRAIYNVDELADKLAALREEESELEEFIGLSLAMLKAVRSGLGDKYADVVEWRYIDGEKWTEIADIYDVSERTAQNWAQIAFDWIDSVGVTRLLRGQTEL